MMDLLLATSGGESQSASGGYVDDVFSAYLYTGNGATQTINNGIDLAGEGGLVWMKKRSSLGTHALVDTHRGADKYLASHTTNSTVYTTGNFEHNGYSLFSSSACNDSAASYVSWTFRRAPKFFDVVTYTGNGTLRTVPHSLASSVGFLIVKRTDTGGTNWTCWHRGLSANKSIDLNTTDAEGSGGIDDFGNGLTVTNPTSTEFTLGTSSRVNATGGTYVAYLFAHDPSAEGIVQCGSIVNPIGSGQQVTLGWEPQFVLWKRTDAAGDWNMHDVMRGVSNPEFNQAPVLFPNLSNAESTSARISVNATGFAFSPPASTATYIYLAIRRPNKPPTSGAQVYSSSTSSGVVSAGFPVDLHIGATRTGAASNHAMHTRLTGGTRELVTSSTAAEATITDLGFGSMTGLKASLPSGMVNHFFRRAHGFMDVVCDTGTGVAHAITHNLTKAPELIIRKSRSAATQWEVWHSAMAATEKLVLNSDAVKTTDTAAWNSTLPTATQFTVGTGANVNANAATFVTYLFATLAGISKVGSYTGNGTSQTINCGFATGARFILVKATSTTGNWWVFDSARGIVSSFDPSLALNSTAAEVTTDDSVDPEASGFIANQNTATNINVNGGQYIFLAIA